MSWHSWIGRVALVCAAVAAGCNGDNNNNNNNGNPDGGAKCTSGVKECVTDAVARQCQSDGTWAAFKCIGGHCTNGDCVEDEPMPVDEQICLPGEGACQGSMALTCNSTGTAYTATACPSGTTCVGPGLCQGTCVIGQAFCYDLTHIATCNDGKQFTTTACTGTDLCVATDNGVIDKAVCKPAECTPSANGCDAVCGDKKNPNNDPTKSVSRCVETPAGYKWEVLPCPAPYTCSPGASDCGSASNPGVEAACAVDCLEGSKRCGSATTIETCTNGVWSAGVDCNDPTSGAASKVCVVNANDPLSVACGDPACVNGIGACTADGKFLPCQANGQLNREPQTCTTGVCVADSAPTSGSPTAEVPGRCAALCTEGEERCIDVFGQTSSSQKCMNGKWESYLICTDENTTCLSGIVDGKTKVGCYEDCFPGSSFCDSDTAFVTCQDDGTYPADVTTCTVGFCVDNADFTKASCEAECLPGQVDCSENDITSDIYPRISTATVTCDANGRWGDPVACEGALTCRYNISGHALGCVECAGQNEVGQPDTRCDEETDSVQTCQPNNTWGTASLACGDGANCVPAEELDYKPILSNYCTDTIFGPLTEDLLLFFNGAGCADSGFGNPVQCATSDGGSVPNCCSLACSPDPVPAPAYCAQAPQ